MNLDITTAPRKDSRVWKAGTTTWAEICAWTGDPAGVKECGNYLLGRLAGNRRTKAAVVDRCVLTLDADTAHGTDIPDTLPLYGWRGLVHTTWTHTPDMPRYRVLLPLSRRVSPEEYRSLVEIVMGPLGRDQFDSGSVEPERYMFRPSTKDRATFRRWIIDGEPLDVDALLAEGGAGEPEFLAGIVRAERNRLAVVDIERHDALFHAAVTLGRYVGISEEVATATLEEASERNGYLREKDAEEIARVISDGLKAGRESPTSTAWEDFAGEPVPEAPTDDVRPLTERFPLLDLRSLVGPDRPVREWFLDGVIPARDVTSLSAPAGDGKSLLMLALIVAAVRGDETFLGRTLNLPAGRRVFYFDLENSEFDWSDRLTSLGVTPDEAGRLMERLHVFSLPPLPSLNTAEGGKVLLALLAAHGGQRGDVVVLDSTQRVVRGEENAAETFQEFYRYCTSVLKARGFTTIRTDNTGWSADRERGTSAKRDEVGAAWVIRRDTQDPEVFTLWPTKLRAEGAGRGITYTRAHDDLGHLVFPLVGSSWEAALLDLRSRWHDIPGVSGVGIRKAWDAFKLWLKTEPPETRDLLTQVTRDGLFTRVHQEFGALTEVSE